METNRLLSTKEVAQFLNINEKMVYTLIAEKGLPATKVTGKWLFPLPLVEQWIENQTINLPEFSRPLPPYGGVVVIAGSNDLLLDKTISLFNQHYPDHLVAFGNLGSLGGIQALRRHKCHMASSHLLQASRDEYNFDVAGRELRQVPAVVNFSKRRQGLLVARGNPKNIGEPEDLVRSAVRLVNRRLGTGTRHLLDLRLREAGVEPESLPGYDNEVGSHLEVGLEILAGRADAGPGIEAVASVLGLDFIPWRWERFDFLIARERFFDQGVQMFLGFLHEPAFRELAAGMDGYDLELCGKMLFPQEARTEEDERE